MGTFAAEVPARGGVQAIVDELAERDEFRHGLIVYNRRLLKLIRQAKWDREGQEVSHIDFADIVLGRQRRFDIVSQALL